MRKILLILLMMTALSAWGQISYPYIFLAPSDPTGQACGQAPQLQTVYSTGAVYSCDNGVWAVVGGGAATSVPFSGITSATNTAAAMVVGSGASLAATGTGTITATSVTSTPVPGWLLYYGDGSDGAFSCPSGTCSAISGEKWYSSVNVAAGAILPDNNSKLPLIIRSTGTCTIAGTLGSSANVGAGGGIVGGASYGGGGGGGGGGTAAGVAGGNSFGNAGGGTAGAITGGNAGNGSNTNTTGSTATEHMVLAQDFSGYSTLTASSFSQYGGAGGGAGGSGGGTGGLGGGIIALICPTINFTGTIDVSGQVGGASTGNNVGPGGGGGGGVVILRSPALTNSGTITVTGASGGSCGAFTGCGTAGTGAAGWSKAFSN